ncbi:MAG: HAD family hydrolase [Clostridia bacterium]|nr:HAD family hydrolase [Clostridia bacterium]
MTNEEMFWHTFAAVYGADVRRDAPLFEAFYRTDFQNVAEVCGHTPEAAEVVARLKEAGLKVVLATNPLFPSIATESRMRWAGLDPRDFDYYTTYENASFCKPTLAYYRQILDKIGAKPEECLMVGNDVAEDMVVEELGM